MIEGYKPITTQIFDKDSDYLTDDSVFAVKDSLVVEFKPRKDDPQATFELKYDISMAPADDTTGAGTELATSAAISS